MRPNNLSKQYVYLLHFAQPIAPNHPCQHYLGTASDLDARIREHRIGRPRRGARLCQVARERGITFRVAEVWAGDRHLERSLKRLKNAPKLCPICESRNSAASG